MKITPTKFFTAKKIFTFSAVFLLPSHSSFAWDGIDLKKNSTVTIESGNFVREGSIIDFYDSDDGNYHTGRILIMNSVSRGTEITIEDFTAKNKERVFLMNE